VNAEERKTQRNELEPRREALFAELGHLKRKFQEQLTEVRARRTAIDAEIRGLEAEISDLTQESKFYEILKLRIQTAEREVKIANLKLERAQLNAEATELVDSNKLALI